LQETYDKRFLVRIRINSENWEKIGIFGANVKNWGFGRINIALN